MSDSENKDCYGLISKYCLFVVRVQRVLKGRVLQASKGSTFVSLAVINPVAVGDLTLCLFFATLLYALVLAAP